MTRYVTKTEEPVVTQDPKPPEPTLRQLYAGKFMAAVLSDANAVQEVKLRVGTDLFLKVIAEYALRAADALVAAERTIHVPAEVRAPEGKEL